jgi:purine-binding chemotaxis protein CheW
MSEKAHIERTWVGFEVGGVTYALPIQYVREIIRPLPMQVLPHASATVIGVIDHRGDVVPIVDLRLRFRATQTHGLAHTRWVIANWQGRLIGLVVDRVTEVFPLKEADARPVPDLGYGREALGITAAYAYGGRLVFTLDVESVTQTSDSPLGIEALPAGAEGT